MTLNEPEDLLGAFHRAIRPVRRPNPLVLAWRWRYEITGAVGAVFAVPWLAGLPLPVLIGIGGGTALMLGLPPIRRLLWRRLRAIVVAHRLRTAFVRARVHTNDGRIPTILLTSPRARADRVLLFLPAGLTPGLLAGEVDRIAVACEGEHAEVLPVGNSRSVVRLVIIRR